MPKARSTKSEVAINPTPAPLAVLEPEASIGHPKSARTSAAREVILRALCAGCSYAAAAALGGLSPSTLVNWRQEEESMKLDCERARAEMQLAALQRIEEAAMNGAWVADAWRLERIFHETYGRRQALKIVAEDTVDDQPGKIYRVVFEPPRGEVNAESVSDGE